MKINKAKGIFTLIMCAIGIVGWVLTFLSMKNDDHIGGMLLWAALGCMFIASMIGASIEFIKTIIQYRKYNQTLQYGNVKSGDCISASRLIK